MTEIDLNGNVVSIPDSWFDVTCMQFLGFKKIIESQKTEKEIEEMYQNDTEEIRALQVSLANVEFNTKVMMYWTGLTEEDIAMCSLEDVEMVMQTMNFMNEQYEPISIGSFTFEGEKYYLPKANMVGENFGTYIEAEQVEINNKHLNNGNLEVLPKQIAILCKKEGEKPGLIDDNVVAQREKLFMRLDMATIWDVAFFLFRQESSLMTVFLTYLQKVGTQKQEWPQKEQ